MALFGSRDARFMTHVPLQLYVIRMSRFFRGRRVAPPCRVLAGDLVKAQPQAQQPSSTMRILLLPLDSGLTDQFSHTFLRALHGLRPQALSQDFLPRSLSAASSKSDGVHKLRISSRSLIHLALASTSGSFIRGHLLIDHALQTFPRRKCLHFSSWC